MTITTREDYTASIDQAHAARAAYFNTDVELLSDSDYDDLLLAIEAFETANPSDTLSHGLFTDVGAGTDSTPGDVTHTTQMMSLDKSNTTAELDSFLDGARRVGANLAIEPKLDGCALDLQYPNGALTTAALRGDGDSAENVTGNVRGTRGLPDRVNMQGLSVRGEIVMTPDDFAIADANRVASGKASFANPRNAVAGTLRRKTITYEAPMTFVAYDAVIEGGPSSHTERMAILTTLGFTTSLSLMPTTTGTPADIVEEFGSLRKVFPYPTDGIVLKVDSDDIRASMGATSRAPRWATAFKYRPEIVQTILRGVTMGVGRTGAISFTADMDPVRVSGSTVAHCTLHNFNFIISHDLRIGDVVEVFKAGEIIPRVEKSLPEFRDDTVVPYNPERVCPLTGEPLDTTSSVIWRSPSPQASLGGWLTYATGSEALDVDGLGAEIIAALIDTETIGDLADLFTLTESDLANLRLGATASGNPRVLGQRTAAKIIAELELAKAKPFNRVITALGIRKVGKTFGRRLMATFHTMDSILAADHLAFHAVEGVRDGRAEFYVTGFNDRRELIAKLAAAGVNMGVEPDPDDNTPKPLDGLIIVVTGTMTGILKGLGRTAMAEVIEAHGGKLSDTVNAATSYLVCPAPKGTKWAKAVEIGTEIIKPDAFAGLLAGIPIEDGEATTTEADQA